MKPVLFVSHSSKDNDLAKTIVSAIEKGTSCKTIFDVHDLQQGTEWKPQLYQWLAHCRAALILLTENGLDSDWVLQEATILRARKALESDLRVFVVAPRGLKERKPERWKLFDPLRLDEIQGLLTFDSVVISQKVIDAINAMVGTGEKTYFDRLAGLLYDILIDLESKKATLDLIADKMALDDADWQALIGGNERIVDLIARRLCRGDLGQYAKLRDFLAVLKSVSTSDTRRHLLDVLGSYWVDVGAAAIFSAVAQGICPYQ